MKCTKSSCNRFPAMVHAADSALCESLRIAAVAVDSIEPVLLTGETGTGKDILARAIHDASPRKDHPFLLVNCPGLSPGTAASQLFGVIRNFAGLHRREPQPGEFDRAQNGTIFLNEVGDFPEECQTQLHEVLDYRRFARVGGARVDVNVRVIAATLNPAGIRPDTRQRFAVFPIEIPALRFRKGDITELANHFSQGKRILPAVYEKLIAYDWPENVRQLQNAMKFALASSSHGDAITLDDLPTFLGESRRRVHRLKNDSLTLLQLDEVSATFPFSPGLVLSEIVPEDHQWRRELGAPSIVIVDDHAANRKNYQDAAAYLKERIQLRSGIRNFDPSVDVISPDELKVNFAHVYQRLKSCVLLVLDLDFSDARLWKNGFVLMGYSVAACPWLRDAVLWVTQTGEDVFQETYLSEAMAELQMCPDLAPRVRELLSGPVYAHPAIIQGRPRRPIPPYGPHLEPDESQWWWDLGGHMGEILGNQQRAITLWLNDQESSIPDAATLASQDQAKSEARHSHSGQNTPPRRPPPRSDGCGVDSGRDQGGVADDVDPGGLRQRLESKWTASQDPADRSQLGRRVPSETDHRSHG
jgi:hypothetical protein